MSRRPNTHDPGYENRKRAEQKKCSRCKGKGYFMQSGFKFSCPDCKGTGRK